MGVFYGNGDNHRRYEYVRYLHHPQQGRSPVYVYDTRTQLGWQHTCLMNADKHWWADGTHEPHERQLAKFHWAASFIGISNHRDSFCVPFNENWGTGLSKLLVTEDSSRWSVVHDGEYRYICRHCLLAYVHGSTRMSLGNSVILQTTSIPYWTHNSDPHRLY